MKKLVDGGPSLVPTNQVGRSFATAVGLQTERESKNKNLTLEMDGESHPNKTVNTTCTVATDRRHPFTIFARTLPYRTSRRDLTEIGTMGRPIPMSTWTHTPLT